MNYYLSINDSINEYLRKCKNGDVLYLSEGIYEEKIKISVEGIKIIGNNTTIQYKDYYNKVGKDNKELLTVRTYTLMVAADNVTLENLTIKNLALDNNKYGQAVALHVIGDNFKANHLKLIGGQDTLLAGPIPYDLTIRYKDLLPQDELTQKKSHQYYEDCYIEGNVDFIFGCGICLFESCTIHSSGKGYICAPSHPQEYKYGFVFINCNLTSSTQNENNVFLARPWRDYGHATFIDCKSDKHIKPDGFNNWNPEREKTCKMEIYKTLDYNSLVKFAKILTEDDLKIYTKENILTC